MSLSVVQICNMALARVGVSQGIASLDESLPEARMCGLFYESCRDRALRDFDWPFARQIEPLALVAQQPNTQWRYAYRFPAEAVALRRLVLPTGRLPVGRLNAVPWELGNDDVGRLVLTDQTQAVACYTRQVTDPTQFDPAFGSALAWLLAAEIAMPLAVRTELRNNATQHYLMEMSAAEAQAANEAQGDPPPESDMITARY